MTEQTLKNCPFCGSDDVVFGGIPGCVSVVCENCNCVKVGYDNHEQAMQEWNQRADGWISVDDRLPEKIHEEYLIWPRHDILYSCEYIAYFDGKNWLAQCEDTYHQYDVELKNITHWQPLPPPPGVCDE